MLPSHTPTELAATICLALAILHTFLVKKFRHLGSQFPEGSVPENLFHLLGELEVVFGIWAAFFLTAFLALEGKENTLTYLHGRNFTEPIFVFVIMAVCSTKPILEAASGTIQLISRFLPLKAPVAFYFATLTIGPLLGSFITEPAAMTVTALILLNRFYSKSISNSLKYSTLGLLFVNISIGGTLTPYAAPPVLMVAGKWNWDLSFMLLHFGWKGFLASTISTILITLRHRKEIERIPWNESLKEKHIPFWVISLHVIFLTLIVLSAHYPVVSVGFFLFFLGMTSVTREYQSEIKIKESLLVGFFLAGLIVLGEPQKWWLQPILSDLNSLPLYLGSIALTSITDNAALTYLGSQVPDLSEASKYFLVAGSVVGGGLTVIANAPNPAGFGILNESFGEDGISALGLFISALLPTAVALLIFGFV